MAMNPKKSAASKALKIARAKPPKIRIPNSGSVHIGLIDSDVPGRTDKHPMGVAPGSYVIPADIVSGVGQGNTKAGADAFNKLLKMGPYGTPGKFADGGNVNPIEIVAAGGEIVVPPESVADVGGGDVDRGHSILDAMVKRLRSQTIRQLKSLPGPKKN